jgi:hypothetical protein
VREETRSRSVCVLCHAAGKKDILISLKGQMVQKDQKGDYRMAKNSTPLTEKVLVSMDTKQAIMSIREPGERYGDVIGRVLQERKRHDFIAHLDKIAEEGDFVPLDSDPEYASLKKEMRRESKHRQAGAAVR